MCMSVPQMAVLAILISTSFGPDLRDLGCLFIQMPGFASLFTNAFMVASLPMTPDRARP